MDHISKEHRSWNMSRIRSQDTKPELHIRKYLYSKGFRFRLNGKTNKKRYLKGILPGKPDIVLSKHKTVIFIHGCFWHQHKGCKRATIPKSNTIYWTNKLKNNVERDKENTKKLKHLGWQVIIIWECEIKSNKFIKKLERIVNEKI